MNITQDKSRLTAQQVENGELNGFQWTISNPVAYVLKYVTKSFLDIKNKAEIDELQAWYILNRIVRFTTSHTLVPQWVYNKIFPLESDWLYLSDLKTNSFCEWSQEDDYFKFQDIKNNKILQYNRGLYQYYQDDVLVREFGTFREKLNNSLRVELRPCIRKKNKIISVYVGNDKFLMKNEKLINCKNIPFQPKKAGNYALYSHFITLDPETVDLKRYGFVKNECINRGLVDGVVTPIDNYNTDFEKIGA